MTDHQAAKWDAQVDGLCALPYELPGSVRWEQEPDTGIVHLALDQLGGHERLHPRVLPILEAIEQATSLPEVVELALPKTDGRSKRSVARSARHLITLLADQGTLKIRLPPVPEVFQARYERVRELGRGGVGVVWLCHDLKQDRAPVVVKHAWNWTGPLERRDQALRDEAGILLRLDHPGVVGLHDQFELDGRFHLVRDYVEGTELARHVLWGGGLDEDQRIALLAALADVLEHLHERGVLLLDLAPSNVMLTEAEPGLVLPDLGHARVMEEGRVTFQGSWGTKGYAAPEMRAGEEATVASDIYGLGCLACFLVTRRAPHGHGGLEPALDAMREGGAGGPELALVEACYQEEAEDRPGSPSEACSGLTS